MSSGTGDLVFRCLRRQSNHGLEKFIENRLIEQQNGFYDRDQTFDIFNCMLKKSAHKVANMKVMLKADHGLFARMVVIA